MRRLPSGNALSVTFTFSVALADSDSFALARALAGSRRDRANDDRAVGPESRHERERRL